ncbi:MAG: hypothetical protein QW331_02775 [Candidatus Woesearchaeota archaeon]
MAEQEVKIKLEKGIIEANLVIPENSLGIVLFAHGSGSGRFSPRNKHVAQILNKILLAILAQAPEQQPH